MRLAEIAKALVLEKLTPGREVSEDVDVTAGYSSDLLSDVLAHAPSGGVLVTIHTHMNVLAVALHASLTAVVFAANRRPDEAVIRRAVDDGIQLYGTRLSAFDVVGRLYQVGLRGPAQ